MLRQTHQPDKIILWLSEEQFADLSGLPKSLLKLQKRGLEIVFCNEDLRSHKKYYYSLINYPDDILVTVDDDFIYRSTLISDLITLHKRYPKAICCDRALRIKTNDGKILPYSDWELIKRGEEQSYRVFHTSGGGTLYSPASLSSEVLNKEIFLKYCKYADDIWLNFMAQMNNTPSVKTDSIIISLPIIYKVNITLASMNVDEGLNDVQLKLLREYYSDKTLEDPLANIFIS